MTTVAGINYWNILGLLCPQLRLSVIPLLQRSI